MEGHPEVRPEEWTVDQVAYQLFHNESPPWVSQGLKPIPNKEQLEQVFRENDVDGSVLLELSADDLKNELHITSLGQRKAIEKVVQFLRGEPQQSVTPAPPLSLHEKVDRFRAGIPTPDFSRRSPYPHSAAWESNFGEAPAAAGQYRIDPTFDISSTETPYQLSTQLRSGIGQDVVGPQHNSMMVNVDSQDFDLSMQDKSQFSADGSPVPDLLDTLDTSINRSLWPASDQSHEPRRDFRRELQQQRQYPQVPDPDIESKPKPKRRIAPTFIRPIQRPVSESKPGRHRMALYLQDEALSMQDTFFGEFTDADEKDVFKWHIPPPSRGTSQVIAGRMKRFLMQQPRAVPGLAYEATYILPYTAKDCAGPFSEPFFTLYAANASPSIQKIQDWPEIQKASSQEQKQVARKDDIVATYETNAHAERNPKSRADVTPSDLGDLAYLLEKYPPAVNDEEALPMYGDSGDENTFDDDLWQEIEEEREERDVAASGLTRQQISSAIDEAIKAAEDHWRARKLAKVQSKAYRLWMQVVKKKKSRTTEVGGYYAMRSHKKASLSKMRESILKDQWRSLDEVTAQCVSLEETLFQILECEHILEVLHSNDPPEKPQTKSMKRQRSTKPKDKDGEETLESESDFIVEDGDQIMPDISADEDFHPDLPPKGNNRTTSRTSSASHSEDIQMQDVSAPSLTQFAPMEPSPNPAQERLDEPESTDALPVDDDVDADIDSDSDIGDSLARRRKNHNYVPSRYIRRADWSPSSEASPVLPPSVQPTRLRVQQGSDPDNSDLDLVRLPPSKFKHLGASKEDAIELLSSDPARPEYDTPSGFDSVTTPPLNAVLDSDDEPLRRQGQHRHAARYRPPTLKRESLNLSPLQDPDLADRISALEAGLRTLMTVRGASILDLVSWQLPDKSPYFNRKSLGALLGEALVAMDQNQPFRLAGVPVKSMTTVLDLTKLYLCFFHKTDLIKVSANKAHLNEAHNKRKEHDKAFEKELNKSLEFYKESGTLPNTSKERATSDKQKKAQGTTESKRPEKRKLADIYSDPERNTLSESSDVEALRTSDEIVDRHTPHKKKKRRVAESQEARLVQKDDRARVKEQHQRRQVLAEKMQSLGAGSSAQVIVNSVEPSVFLDPHIASRVKPHQIEGIQFLWREIVEDPRHQGCLLAHTMGLGKTMQVISLLVAIAQTSTSQAPGAKEQLPQLLRQNKTLVLCPSSLVENWFDELLMWAPPDYPNVFGGIFKITGRDKADQIPEWADSGGVLIVSYDTFRSLLKPAANTRKAERDRVPQYEKWLLDTPSVVVADEAHKIKNPKANISVQAKRFKTRSRIALTGSPLNNHLEEYHTMLEWIAPGYLGDIAQFRQKYIDPINAGLYQESTAWERRMCLRKLHTLKKDIEPKVNRADIEAIRSDMPPKTEYIITIPLAELQREAYDVYVANVMKQGDHVSSRGLFKWLNHLQVLVAHPSCFLKVVEKHEESADTYDSSTEAENQSEGETRRQLNNFGDDYDPLATNKVTRTDLAAETAAAEVFRSQHGWCLLDESALSYRTLVTKKIVEKAMACGDKTLVFSHSIPTLDYLEKMLMQVDTNLMRIDGSTKISDRQKKTKKFNESDHNGSKVFLLSTEAAGLGLNLQGANRVILFDFSFNPMWEEQAVGRAYRLGQHDAVFVYRFKCGGTFEEPIYHKALFKTQLFQRVVDKKNPQRAAVKSVSKYMFPSRDVQKQDFDECLGKDPKVLDQIVVEIDTKDVICNLELTETFQRDDGERLDEEDLKAANEEQETERLRREDPEKYQQTLGLARFPIGQPRLVPNAKPAGGKPAAMPKTKMQASPKMFGKVIDQTKSEVISSGQSGDVSADSLQLHPGRPAQLSGTSKPNYGQIDGAIRVDSSDPDSPNEQPAKTTAAGCQNQ